MSNQSDAPAREPATIRAVRDAATCVTCREGHGRRVDVAMPLSLVILCDHVRNGTGICRCVAVLDGKIEHVKVAVEFTR